MCSVQRPLLPVPVRDPDEQRALTEVGEGVDGVPDVGDSIPLRADLRPQH